MSSEKFKKITYVKGGSAEIHPLEGMRKVVLDVVAEGHEMHHVNAIMQLDVTKPRQLLKQYGEKNGVSLSFTGFLLYCLAQAINENKEVAGYRVGNNIYVFDEIDVSTLIERKTEESYVIPATYIVRRANYKTYKEINDEIRTAQNAKISGNTLGEKKEAKQANLIVKLPKFIRNIIFWKVGMMRNLKKIWLEM